VAAALLEQPAKSSTMQGAVVLSAQIADNNNQHNNPPRNLKPKIRQTAIRRVQRGRTFALIIRRAVLLGRCV